MKSISVPGCNTKHVEKVKVKTKKQKNVFLIEQANPVELSATHKPNSEQRMACVAIKSTGDIIQATLTGFTVAV